METIIRIALFTLSLGWLGYKMSEDTLIKWYSLKKMVCQACGVKTLHDVDHKEDGQPVYQCYRCKRKWDKDGRLQ